MSMFPHRLAGQSVQSFRVWLRHGVSMLMLLFVFGCEYLPERTDVRMQTDDAPLSLAVVEALLANPETSQLHLTVSNPSDGKVRLQGTVTNNGLRVAAEQVAANVDGVRSVINTLYLY